MIVVAKSMYKEQAWLDMIKCISRILKKEYCKRGKCPSCSVAGM